MRWLPLTLNAVVAMLSLAIVVLFMMPVKLRTRPSGADDWQTTTTPLAGAPSNHCEKVETLQLQLPGYMCRMPSPNINVSLDTLVNYWCLPRGARLSPAMISMGRCKLAVDWQRRAGYKVDPKLCHCVDAAWLTLVYLVAICTFMHFCVGCCLGKYGEETSGGGGDLRLDRCCAGVLLVMWLSALLAYLMRQSDVGLYYTKYAHVYPTAYYQYEPLTWFVIYVMLLLNFVLKALEMVLYEVMPADNAAPPPCQTSAAVCVKPPSMNIDPEPRSNDNNRRKSALISIDDILLSQNRARVFFAKSAPTAKTSRVQETPADKSNPIAAEKGQPIPVLITTFTAVKPTTANRCSLPDVI